MFRLQTGIGLILLVMLGTASAQMPTKGLIIKNTDGLIFIDMGRQDNVMKGDLFDIIDEDVVLHPLNGDTLSVTPKSVGALKVLQVYPKMALVELLHIQGNKDPMLMRVAQIQSPDRLVEIERYMKKSHAIAIGGASPRLSLVPGLYQYQMGDRIKGLSLLGVEVASLALGVGYRLSSDDWFTQYEGLGPGLAPTDYDFYFDEASGRRTWSNRFFLMAGALYAYNLIDVMWMGSNQIPMSAQIEKKTELGLGIDRAGRPMLNLMRRF